MSTATKTKTVPRSRTLAEVLRLVKARRQAWHEIPAQSGSAGQTLGEMATRNRVAADAASIRFREVTGALVAALRRHREPVALDGETTLRLNLDGDGPAFVRRQLFATQKGYREFVRALDARDAVRFAGRKAVAP